MSELSEMTGTGANVRLGDKDFNLSPLSLGDFAEFDVWAEEQYWVKVEARIARMPEGLREKLYEKAYEKLDTGGVSIEAMMTVLGMAKLVWLSLRGNHPDVTFGQLQKLITLESREQLQKTMDRLNGMEADEKVEKDEDGSTDPPATETPDEESGEIPSEP